MPEKGPLPISNQFDCRSHLYFPFLPICLHSITYCRGFIIRRAAKRGRNERRSLELNIRNASEFRRSIVGLSVSTVLQMCENRRKRVWQWPQKKHPGPVQFLGISAFPLIVPRTFIVSGRARSPERDAVPGEVPVGFSLRPAPPKLILKPSS